MSSVARWRRAAFRTPSGTGGDLSLPGSGSR